MFKGFFKKGDREDKFRLYSYLDFLLACLSRLAEFSALAILCAGLADYLAGFLSDSAAFWAGGLLTIGPACLVLAAVMAVFAGLRGNLRGSCGLDVRPTLVRFKSVAPFWVFGFFYLWLVSWAMLMTMRGGGIVLWAAVLVVSVWVLVLLAHQFKTMRLKTDSRPMTDEEIPAELNGILANWASQQKGAVKGRLMTNEFFGAGLSLPEYVGRDVVVTKKALAVFRPAGLAAGVVSALVSQMLRLNRNMLILRLAILTMCAPISMVLLYSFGFMLGYPAFVKVGHLPLIWLGCWLGWQACRLVMSFVSRLLRHRLNLAVAAILSGADPLISAISTMAAYNYVPWEPAWWLSLTASQPSPKEQTAALLSGWSSLAREAAQAAEAEKKRQETNSAS
ncbi:MAG: hypothetical protein LBJ64_08105 [Deltaproteobacteria bacterium]|jgi:hypothetical protein|nr:hypothetical protein [Deltaproteobacteria bacterium]